MTMSKLQLLVLIAALAGTGCSYKKELTLDNNNNTAPATGCDTATVRYSVEIAGIINSKCISCHGSNVANSLGGGNRLDSYNNLRPYTSGDFLLNVVLQTPGYNAMPKGGSKLSDCDIAKIRTWMRNGAPNN
jgi:mono/diheme cytochrome c family protein